MPNSGIHLNFDENLKMEKSQKKILVLGFDTACHSPMMAALIKHITYNRVDVSCAGIQASAIHPFAIKILHEIGVDLTKENPKLMNEFIHTKFDIIISTSEEAREKVTSLLNGNTKIHKEFDDPRLTEGDDAAELENNFRILRDEMNEWLNEFVVRHRLIPY